MRNLSESLSANFTLRELVKSSTAERDSGLKEQQDNPSDAVTASLAHLARVALQPMREILRYPIEITSGYRSPIVNKLVGGSGTSQHVLGEAADCHLSPAFLTDPATEATRQKIRFDVEARIGAAIRPDVDENFYLFAVAALNLERLDVDQLIHEYGSGFGRPAWVHVSASTRANKRQILFVGRYTNNQYVAASLEQALRNFT